jgi:hypothetical protein
MIFVWVKLFVLVRMAGKKREKGETGKGLF